MCVGGGLPICVATNFYNGMALHTTAINEHIHICNGIVSHQFSHTANSNVWTNPLRINQQFRSAQRQRYFELWFSACAKFYFFFKFSLRWQLDVALGAHRTHLNNKFYALHDETKLLSAPPPHLQYSENAQVRASTISFIQLFKTWWAVNVSPVFRSSSFFVVWQWRARRQHFRGANWINACSWQRLIPHLATHQRHANASMPSAHWTTKWKFKSVFFSYLSSHPLDFLIFGGTFSFHFVALFIDARQKNAARIYSEKWSR